VATLLEATLNEEETDQKLSQVALAMANPAAGEQTEGSRTGRRAKARG